MLLKIDEEFKSLIPPLTAEEFQQLKENIIQDGCRDDLITWNSTIIDGHNRYQICQENDIPFKITAKTFDERSEAIEWIIKNQFGRRNLQNFVRCELALRLKPIIQAKAKENLASHTEQGYQKSEKAVHTLKEVAKAAGVSHDTIDKTEKILEKGTPEQINRARQGGKGNSVNAIFKEVREKTETKICSICGQTKTLSEYYEGMTDCKKCQSARKSAGLSVARTKELNEKYPDDVINSYYEEMRNHDVPDETVVAVSKSAIANELSEILHDFNISINKFLFSEDLLSKELFLKSELQETIINLTKINNFIKEEML